MKARQIATLQKAANGEPEIQQQPLFGWDISWNPDDGKFYVEQPEGGDKGRGVAMFKDWRNVVQWTRKNPYAERRTVA